ncbi:MAG: TIGR01459 family HAD-type hydrolase [Pseudomonadota bacterium]
MTDLLFPVGLRELANRYDAVFCDVWGVIHNGRRAFEPACEALVQFRETGGRVVLITNAPVPKAHVLRYFEPLGVPSRAFDDCVSSGDAARTELQTWTGRKVWVLGVDESFERDRFLYDGLDLELVGSPEAADAVLCIGLEQAHRDDPEAHRSMIKPAAERRLPMLCANPDIVVRVGDRLVYCAGAVAQIYEQLGGPVIYPGKPYPTIYSAARSKLAAIGGPVEADRILCIGDGPATDIRGAQNQGLDSLYVGSGLNQYDAGGFAAGAPRILADAGVTATYAMPELAW